MGGLTQPVVNAMGVSSIGGIAVGNLVTIFGLISCSPSWRACSARTEVGQAALTWICEGVAAVIPQFRA